MSYATQQTARPATPMISVRRWLLSAALMILNLFDVLTTKIILSLGGTEENPAMVKIMEHPTYPWLTKMAVCLGVAVLLFAAPKQSKVADRAVTAVVIFYTCVVGWNVSLIANYYLG